MAAPLVQLMLARAQEGALGAHLQEFFGDLLAAHERKVAARCAERDPAGFDREWAIPLPYTHITGEHEKLCLQKFVDPVADAYPDCYVFMAGTDIDSSRSSSWYASRDFVGDLRLIALCKSGHAVQVAARTRLDTRQPAPESWVLLASVPRRTNADGSPMTPHQFIASCASAPPINNEYMDLIMHLIRHYSGGSFQWGHKSVQTSSSCQYRQLSYAVYSIEDLVEQINGIVELYGRYHPRVPDSEQHERRERRIATREAELAELEVQNATQAAEQGRMDAELATRERALKELPTQLAAREGALRERDAALRERESELQARLDSLAISEELVTQQKALLLRRADERVAQQLARVSELDLEVQRRTQDLDARAQDLDARAQELQLRTLKLEADELEHLKQAQALNSRAQELLTRAQVLDAQEQPAEQAPEI